MGQPTHLYRYFDDAGNLLYVGVSASAIRRLLEHAANKVWACLVSRVDVQTLPTREAALAAERKAITDEKPRFNATHNKPPSLKSITRTSRTQMLATRIPHSLADDLSALCSADGPAKSKSEAVILALTCGIAVLANRQ